MKKIVKDNELESLQAYSHLDGQCPICNDCHDEPEVDICLSCGEPLLDGEVERHEECWNLMGL